MLHTRAQSGPSSSSPTAALTTIAYGHGDVLYACAAATWSVLWAQRSRWPRVAVVSGNESSEAIAVLESTGLRVVRDGAAFTMGRNDHDGIPSSRKHPLWALPYQSVLFFDVDHIPISDGHGLSGLLDLLGQPGPTLAATHLPQRNTSQRASVSDSRSSCFNSGLMVLRPSRSTHERISAMIPPSNARCSVGHDQPLLNEAFPPGSWAEVGLERWSVATPQVLAQRCLHAGAYDSVHFFSNAPPWASDCGLRAVHQAPLSPACSCVGPARVQCNLSSEAARRRAGCFTLLDAHAEWWRGFDRLPASAKEICEARFGHENIAAHSRKWPPDP